MNLGVPRSREQVGCSSLRGTACKTPSRREPNDIARTGFCAQTVEDQGFSCIPRLWLASIFESGDPLGKERGSRFVRGGTRRLDADRCVFAPRCLPTERRPGFAEGLGTLRECSGGTRSHEKSGRSWRSASCRGRSTIYCRPDVIAFMMRGLWHWCMTAMLQGSWRGRHSAIIGPCRGAGGLEAGGILLGRPCCGLMNLRSSDDEGWIRPLFVWRSGADRRCCGKPSFASLGQDSVRQDWP